MTIQRQVGFWFAAFVGVALVLFLLRDILLPFAAGFVLAYLFDPLADRLERLHFNRLAATIIILFTSVLVFVVGLMVVVPVLGNQLSAFVDKLPSTVARLQELAAEQGGPLLRRLGGDQVLSEMQSSLGQVMSQVAGWAATFLKSLWSSGQAVIGVVSLVVVTPVVAFYLLIDWDGMVASVDSWVPPRHRETVRMLARQIDGAIAGFIRGQALVCIILGTFYAVGLSLIGLNFGILIGLGSGLLTFIPYVGSLTGLVVSLGVAIVQFWPDWTWIAAVLAVYLFGQFVEGNILSPMLVGDAVGLHPVWLMFALFAFGSMFGFVGVLLAVPLAAAVGVLFRFALRQYLQSPFYDDDGDLPLPPEPARPVALQAQATWLGAPQPAERDDKDA